MDDTFVLRENEIEIEKYFPNPVKETYGIPATFQKISLPLSDETRLELVSYADWQERLQRTLASYTERQFNEIQSIEELMAQPKEKNVVTEAFSKLEVQEKAERETIAEPQYVAIIVPSLFEKGQNSLVVKTYPKALEKTEKLDKIEMMNLLFSPALRNAFPRHQNDKDEMAWWTRVRKEAGFPENLPFATTEGNKKILTIHTKLFIIGRPGNERLYFVAPKNWDPVRYPAKGFVNLDYDQPDPAQYPNVFQEKPAATLPVYRFFSANGKIQLTTSENEIQVFRSEFDDITPRVNIPSPYELYLPVSKDGKQWKKSLTMGPYLAHTGLDIEEVMMFVKKANIYYTGDGFAVSDHLDESQFTERVENFDVGVIEGNDPEPQVITLVKQILFYPPYPTAETSIQVKMSAQNAFVELLSSGELQIKFFREKIPSIIVVPSDAQGETLNQKFSEMGLERTEWTLNNDTVTFELPYKLWIPGSFFKDRDPNSWGILRIPRKNFDELLLDHAVSTPIFKDLSELDSYTDELVNKDDYYVMLLDPRTLIYRKAFLLSVFMTVAIEDPSTGLVSEVKGTFPLLWPREFLRLTRQDEFVDKDRTESANEVVIDENHTEKLVTVKTGPTFYFDPLATNTDLKLFLDAKPYIAP